MQALAASAARMPSGTQRALLMDEQLGEAAMRHAKALGISLAVPTEASMSEVFTFEHGDAFGNRIEAIDPDYVKALVFHSDDMPDEQLNIQMRRLVTLSDWLTARGRRFMLEVLIQPTQAQVSEGVVGATFEDGPRADATCRAVAAFHRAGVEPTIWKLEGFALPEFYEQVVDACRTEGREAELVVLGRGQDTEAVGQWLTAAAAADGCIGFAVGRTIWQTPLTDLWRGRASEEEAVATISENYLNLCHIYVEARQSSAELWPERHRAKRS